ncbi:hypothetical protein [Saccharopolyspora spinosa]|uniref:Excreted virulence factor EspC (Type VII ESX diderm) n=1 Tax=Saccharopolyspora spinosa TaxID=60894 RepID=A0A2N3XRR5_SACSN|nr:hypothetical protein [Saccharopolyspora spinosa]PKW13365.1 hypothetical protein A8926_0889 [Saccharopolyspora spinosa]
MTTGMEGLAAGVSALAGQAEGLRAAVDSGQLVMDPEAAERVAKVYDEKAEALFGLRRNTRQLLANGAYGNCFIGRAMNQKFSDKVNAPEVGLVAILTKVEQILRDMAKAYRDSARDMRDKDEEHARNLKRNF